MDPNQLYSAADMERMMELPEVFLKTITGKMRWWEAANIIELTDRGMRRAGANDWKSTATPD